MNKRVLFIVITILCIIVVSVFVKKYNMRNVGNKETERIDSIEKDEKFPYEEDSNYYLYEEPNDDFEYEFIELKMV